MYNVNRLRQELSSLETNDDLGPAQLKGLELAQALISEGSNAEAQQLLKRVQVYGEYASFPA
jgi:hypothetical protein